MIICIVSGGDWTEGLVEHCVLLTQRSLGDLEAEHRADERSRDSGGYAHCARFRDWLIAKGYARAATADELTIWEC